MNDWIENTGQFGAYGPRLDRVDIRLNADGPYGKHLNEWHFQDPKKWDWQRGSGVVITYYRQSDQP